MGKTTRWLKGLFGMKSATSEPNSSKDRQRWGNGGSGAGICHNPATIPPNITPAEAAWLKSYFPHAGDTERNKHAVAVAAATAAAADAAVAAAQAAVEVVRLTSRRRNRNNNRDNLNRAAATIQANFRGYLARKALRALKGLVKIQALVRGYLIRKQATATLHSMQALIRAQATVRSKRASIGPAHNDPEGRSIGPPSPGQSRRMSSSFEARTLNPPTEQDTPKVVEVDLGQHGSRSARRGTRSYSELGEDPGTYQAHIQFQSPARLVPSRLFIPSNHHHHHQQCRCHHLHCREWECSGPATTQTTPRFSGSGSQGEWGREQVYYQYPNYMAKTTSYKAKVRSMSAPKQRPEPRKRISLSEMMEGRNSLSGVRMQRSCSHVQQHPINFKNAVMGKFGQSSNW